MTKASDVTYEYSQSHQGRGTGYVSFFNASPRLRILWDMEKQILDDVLAMHQLAEKPLIRYLDFACGTGRITSYIEDKVHEAVGVDISASMLATAQKHVRKARLIHRNILETPLEQESLFDLITTFRFFGNAQHTLRLEVIQALARMLAPGGVLIFNNHRRAASLNVRLRKLATGGRSKQYSNVLTDAQVHEMLTISNLKIIRQYHLGVIPTTHMRLSLPHPLFRWAEKRLAKCRWASNAAEYHVYVCQRVVDNLAD